MRMNKLIGSVLAIALAAPYTVVSTSAAETFSSAEDLITDAVNVALAGIASSTMNNGIAYMQSKLSVSGDAVLYDGNTIGYWYSDSSDILYADSTKTEKLIAPTTDGYTVDPDTLKPILIDINSKLKDVYTPTSDDWSKLIHKYDVTLGDFTVPADQWVKTAGALSTNAPFTNMYTLTNINVDNIGDTYEDNSLIVFAYAIDKSGDLYIQAAQTMISLGSDSYWHNVISYMGSVDQKEAITTFGGGSAIRNTTCSTAKVALVYSNPSSAGTTLTTAVKITNDLDTVVSTVVQPVSYSGNTVIKVDGSGTKYSGSYADLKETGFCWLTSQQMEITDWTTFHNKTVSSARTSSCSKTVVGNTKLSKRITKLASLADSDVLSVTSAGWFVNGTENFDTLFGVQQLTNAGDTADINAVAEIEPLTFNVVVPTTLPLYIDSAGVVTTASNATVTNKSNAAVKLTDIDIIAKDDSGWTLVASDPSPVRDAQEFTFTTSLVKDTVLQKDEVHPFTYNAELSPITSGADALDLATVSVTVDWAD